MFSELSELIFPSRCMSCGVLGPTICTPCRTRWNPHIYRKSIDGLRVYAAVPYSQTAQKIILGAKESGYRECDLLLIHALKKSLTSFLREVGDGVLVPIPSRAHAIRKRGRDFIFSLTQELEHPCENVLRLIRPVRDQSRLSYQLRYENLECAFQADTIESGDVILIDDIVTSGATLLEARRAFQRRGIRVKGAITAAMA